MIRTRSVVCGAAFAALLFGFGCGGGGGGGSSESNPEGTFTMDLVPFDGSKVERFDVELDVDGGFVDGNYARLIDFNNQYAETDLIDGVASNGFIDGTADFSKTVGVQIDFTATFNGGEWTGEYTVREGSKILEQGDLVIDKTGSSSKNVEGEWSGTFDFNGDGFVDPWTMNIAQKGNRFVGVGMVALDPVEVAGSVVGRDVVFEMTLDIDSGVWNCFGRVDSSADDIEGTVVQDGSFNGTMVGEKD